MVKGLISFVLYDVRVEVRVDVIVVIDVVIGVGSIRPKKLQKKDFIDSAQH
jgi:hypothetical protein